MPNENAPICGCSVVVDLPKSRSGSRKLTMRIPKSKSGKSEGGRSSKKEDGRSKNRTCETGSCSSVTEQARPNAKTSKHEKRLNHSRRTRSAERAESHYTYIDSSSSILGGGIRENAIPEALYATIPDTTSASEIGNSHSNGHGRSQPVYAIPSMVSPPPTYDVAIAKTWQSGLPPTYDEYLCHKYPTYAMISRSHTPPPPWSDSNAPVSSGQTRRELLASQPDLREYLAQLTLAQNSERAGHYQQQHQGTGVLRGNLSNQQNRGQVRAQLRVRAMPPRSQSESRAQQQRIATMYEDGAFCMETTALQSAFEHGIAFCSLM